MGRARELAEVATAYDSGGLNFRNRIINGDMRIDQRNNGASVSIGTSDPFIVDRWKCYTDLLNMTGQRSTVAPAGFVNSLGITVGTGATPSAGQISRLEQRIEGFNTADLGWGTASAQAVTVSFWVRSSVTGTHSGALTNAGSNRSYPFTFTVSAANTWEQKTITVPGDTSGTWATDNGVGCIVKFNLGTGSTFLGAAGSWAASNFFGATGSVNVSATSGATFYITGVQLEAGSVATPFERRPYSTELQLCQRYFRTMQRAAGNTGTAFAVGTCYGSDAIYISSGGAHPVEMRSTPTLSTVSTFRVEDGSSAQWTVSSIVVGASTSTVFCPSIFLTTNGPAGRVVYLQATNDASRIQLSAEL